MQIRLSPLFVWSSAFGAICIHRMTTAEILNDQYSKPSYYAINSFREIIA